MRAVGEVDHNGVGESSVEERRDGAMVGVNRYSSCGGGGRSR